MDKTPEKTKKNIPESSDKEKIRRFSKIEAEKYAPFFKLYNPKPDPVIKQEKRKMRKEEYPIKKPELTKLKYPIKDKEKAKKKLSLIEKEELRIEDKAAGKYVVPKTSRQIRKDEERRKKHDKYLNEFICPKEVIRLPSPVDIIETEAKKKKLKCESTAVTDKDKVVPTKISMTESTLKWPKIPPTEELMTKVPKSKIIINKDKKKAKKFPPVDSVDYIYIPPYRREHHWYKMYRGPDDPTLFPVPIPPATEVVVEEEEEEEEEEERTKVPPTPANKKSTPFSTIDEMEGESAKDGDDKKPSKTMSLRSTMKPKTTLRASVDLSGSASENEMDYGEYYGEGEEEDLRRSISKVSAATSIASMYKMQYPADDQYDRGSLVPSVINRILQKYTRESELELIKQEKQPYKPGTLKSHSTTKVHAVPKSFFFGVREGSMHYGDGTFSTISRYRQGLPMCVAAYVMSFIKPPPKWNTKDIDFVLELGDKLFLKSLEINHLHDTPRILQPEELCDVIELVDKKIKYKIDEPDIAGFTKSNDPKIYNLLKGLTLFFKRHRSGIFQTYNTNILIFKKKFFFVFDPEPRTNELYSMEHGKAILASFYDLPSVLIMLLDRGKLDNWPFIISKISIRKIATVKDKDDVVSLSSEFREESLYKIINPYKAVVRGAVHIDDPCFGETRNKQAFAVATIAIVYSQVTPACAWHRKTVHKILLVANQFFIECVKDTEVKELTLRNIPAFFTIGPLMIEITIYANQYAGLMYRKGFCLFEELLTKFFCHNSSAIVEIDRFVIAIWKHREVFYSFDPYSRDKEGLRIKEGVACVSMNVNIESIVKTIVNNFTIKDYIFKIHALKVVRINRDPEFGKYPRSLINSEQSIIENIKITDKNAFTPKNITVDKTETAAKITMLEEPLDPSIVEVGSYVGSLDQKYVRKIPTCLSKPIITEPEKPPDKLFDLDSASLSDTQIEKDRPSPLKTDSFEFKLLDEILKEELELTKLMELGGEGEGEGYETDYWKLIENLEMSASVQMEDEMIQKGKDLGIIEKRGVYTNTDLLALQPIEREVLEPNKPPKRWSTRRAGTKKKTTEAEEEINQKNELAKPSNFIDLPDGSQILYGTQNIATYGEKYDDAAPFVAAISIVMAKKYTLNTWTQNVVDSVAACGFSLFNNIQVKFTDAPKIHIPKLEIGSLTFQVTIDYAFDSLLAHSILEQCLEKLIFKEFESAIVVTQLYSAAVFKKRYLYYMYDPYGNNLVGLGEGPDNIGVACMFRFTNLYALVSRFIYNKKQRELQEPVEASRFIISHVIPKIIFPPPLPLTPRRERQIEGGYKKAEFESDPSKIKSSEKAEKEKPEEPEEEKGAGEGAEKNKKKAGLVKKNKQGYHKKNKYLVLEGTAALTGREVGKEMPTQIKECHFVCVCALIGIFGKPLESWDTRRVNQVYNMGLTLFEYVDNMNFADKRNITNLLFDQYFFDMIVSRLIVTDPQTAKYFNESLFYLMRKNKFLLVQFPNCCYVLYQGDKETLHLFDPYGVPGEEEPKACWIKFATKELLLQYIQNNHKDNINNFFFFTVNISNVRKASKKARMEYKLRVTKTKKSKKIKDYRIFHENEEWLKEYPIPWSRMTKSVASGALRGLPSQKWYKWDVEYPGDLYSITSSKHQCSTSFRKFSRNKQTIANCIVSIIMTEIYDFTEWNSDIMDAILYNGDQYFNKTFGKVKERNYQIKIEDFPLNVNVFPYNVNIEITPCIEGTMFVIRPTQFNLAKGLRYFFESTENRCGIICCNNGRSKTKYVAFGRVRLGEFFMYDCQTIGPPMYIDRLKSRALMLRCTSMNRLIMILTMILRGGDFFIYEVSISEDQTEQVIEVHDLEEAKSSPESAAAKRDDEGEGEGQKEGEEAKPAGTEVVEDAEG